MVIKKKYEVYYIMGEYIPWNMNINPYNINTWKSYSQIVPQSWNYYLGAIANNERIMSFSHCDKIPENLLRVNRLYFIRFGNDIHTVTNNNNRILLRLKVIDKDLEDLERLVNDMSWNILVKGGLIRRKSLNIDLVLYCSQLEECHNIVNLTDWGKYGFKVGYKKIEKN